MELYHFSEEPDIRRFEPRPAKAFPELLPVVFAIDREHCTSYYFPRECPRVIYRRGEGTTEADARELLAHTTADTIIVVESGWLDRIREVRLYRYTFDSSSFELWDATAGYYVSRRPAVPLRVEPVGDLLTRLLNDGVELRLTPSLHPIRNRVIASTLAFSVIRFRNAAEPQSGS